MEVPRKIKENYVLKRKKDYVICLNSLRQENYPELERIGHQLKGNGVTFGFEELSCIGKRMEKHAQDHNAHELEKALKDFSQWVTHQAN